jgi:putative inorganic carbon (HCO3(-)) transporter
MAPPGRAAVTVTAGTCRLGRERGTILTASALPVWGPLGAAAAGAAGFVFWVATVRLPLTWALLSVVALLIPLVAVLCGRWTRFFVAFTLVGLSVNLVKNLTYSDYVGGVAGVSVSLADLGLVAVLLPLGIRGAMARSGWPRLFAPTTLPMLVLFGVMGLSLIVSRDLSLSLYRLLDLAKLFVLYLFVANYTRSEADVWFVVRWLLVGVLVQGTIAILQYMQVFPPSLQEALGWKAAHVIETGVSRPELFRPAGTIGHPNTLGAFFAVTLPLAVSQLMLRQTSRSRILVALALAVGTVALVVTFSRGAWVGFIVGVSLVLSIVTRTDAEGCRLLGRAILVIVIIAMVVAGFSSLVGTRIFEADQGATQNRMLMNDMALQMIQENPALGVGLHTFGLVMREYDELHFAPQHVVHNVYLLVAAESGVGALLAFLWVIGSIAREGVRCIRRSSPAMSTTAAGVLAGLVALWLQMLVEILVSGPPVQISLLFAGLLAAMSRMACSLPMVQPELVAWRPGPVLHLGERPSPAESGPSIPRAHGFLGGHSHKTRAKQ